MTPNVLHFSPRRPVQPRRVLIGAEVKTTARRLLAKVLFYQETSRLHLGSTGVLRILGIEKTDMPPFPVSRLGAVAAIKAARAWKRQREREWQGVIEQFVAVRPGDVARVESMLDRLLGIVTERRMGRP